jgi:hypothetical protein
MVEPKPEIGSRPITLTMTAGTVLGLAGAWVIFRFLPAPGVIRDPLAGSFLVVVDEMAVRWLIRRYRA